jgi:short-subunit dehydrogenase
LKYINIKMQDKVVVITGGSSGIGKALALEFGAKGSKLLITGRRESPLMETAAWLKSQGLEAVTMVADVSQESDNQQMARLAMEQFGGIDILINNAGISMRALFEEVDLDVIRKVMDINFYGALFATKYCLPSIIERQGSVVGVSSIAGYRGLPARVGYSASKFALQGFLESLRTEMLPKNVHVLTACPGFTTSNIRESSLTRDGRLQGKSPRDEQKMMSAETCARLIYKAVKNRKKHLILTRQGKLTVWMNKWFPGFMDQMVYNHMAKEQDSPLG